MLKRFIDKKLGFTLTELLIALTIIGAISAMAVPNLIEGLQKRSAATQVKNFYSNIQEIAREQMAVKKTKNLLDTDFADPAKLMSDKYFQITKKCSSGADCWSEKYRILEGKAVTNRVIEGADYGKSVILKNGAIVTYTKADGYPIMTGTKDKVIGMFRVDVNGNEKPNMIGRDVFWFLISKHGKVVDYYTAQNQVYSKNTAIQNCRSGNTITACLAVVMRNNWVIDY